jgi:hypothetical protein
VRFVDSVDMYHPASRLWRNIIRCTILHCVSSVNSWGHDINNCWLLQLMKDNTRDAFWVQEEHKGGDIGGAERDGYQGGPRGEYGCNHGRGYGRGGDRSPTYFNCGEIGQVSRFCTKTRVLCAYYHSLEHVTKDYPDLVKK